MNRTWSNLEIGLDNFRDKPLKTNKHKKRMVADAVAVEPVSASEFPANREINREFGKWGPPLGFARRD